MLTITTNDTNLVLQHYQRRHLMIQVLNREWQKLFHIEGEVISCDISIDSSSDIRRTANIQMKITKDVVEQIKTINMNYYIKLFFGIEDNKTLQTSWYPQGVFIINQNGFSLDETDFTLSLALSDKMLDFTGDRKGTLNSYTTIVENNQRFDEVMKNLVVNFGGCRKYNITPIHPTFRQNLQYNLTRDNDYLIPMKIELSSDSTIYDVLSELMNVYAGWEIFFDVDGTFICQSTIREDDDIIPLLNDDIISKLKISESPTTFDSSKIKNSIIVWGKDGRYRGEAKNEDSNSSFCVSAIGEIRKVYSGGEYDNIYDRYVDVELHQTQQKEMANLQEQFASANSSDSESINAKIIALEKKMKKNIKYYGDEMAQEWAEDLLIKNIRMSETSSLTLINCPFINEVNFVISYRDEATHMLKTYLVTAVSHNYIDNTTTLTLSKLYGRTLNSIMSKLDTPIIESYNTDDLSISVTVLPVDNATYYSMYLDDMLVTTSDTTTITYDMSSDATGTYLLEVRASANGYKISNPSNAISIIVENSVLTNEGETILTSDNESIIINELN